MFCFLQTSIHVTLKIINFIEWILFWIKSDFMSIRTALPKSNLPIISIILPNTSLFNISIFTKAASSVQSKIRNIKAFGIKLLSVTINKLHVLSSLEIMKHVHIFEYYLKQVNSNTVHFNTLVKEETSQMEFLCCFCEYKIL